MIFLFFKKREKFINNIYLHKCMEKKLVYFSVAILMISLMAVSVTSAGYLDKFITGKATANVNVGVGNSRVLVISAITVGGPFGPTSNSTTAVTGVSFRATDGDGIGSINATSAIYTVTGQSAGTCSGTPSGDYAIDFTCSGATMDFYDAAGVYYVTVSVKDFGPVDTITGGTAANNFTYTPLNSFVTDKSALAWNTTAGASEAKSSDNPLTLTNLGNVGGADKAKVTGYDLNGTVYASVQLPSNDFKVDIADACAGEALPNNSTTTVTNSDTTPGASSTEQFYFCIPTVPSVSFPAQPYTTSTSWIIENTA